MALEEAAQEVCRILRHNNVDETLHYLSTVKRSIEANQHDLRAIMGNSYRDLLVACDGVVGMQRDCADILAIERAIDLVGGQREVQDSGSTEEDTQPLLPHSWFSARLRRQRYATRAATAATVARTIASSGTDNTSTHTPTCAKALSVYWAPSETDRGGSAPAAVCEGIDATSETVNFCDTLQVAFLKPLPSLEVSAPMDAKAVQGTDLMARDASPMREVLQQMQLDDELHALHLDCVTFASAAPSISRGREGAREKISTYFADLSTPALLSPGAQLDQRQHRGNSASSHHHNSGMKGAVLGTMAQEKREDLLCSLEGDLPLLRIARRLRRVQTSLRLYGCGDIDTYSCTRVSSADAAHSSTGAHPRQRPPLWLDGFRRRAITLEARLVKLMLRLLRCAADQYACIREKRDRMDQRTSATSPKAHSSGSVAEKSAQAAQAEVQVHLIHVLELFAQCHCVLRILGDSPTLVEALVACAPGFAIEKKNTGPSEARGEGPAAAVSRSIASVDSAADMLFHLASQDVRTVISEIVDEERRPTPAHTGSSAEAEVLSGAENPCRMLLAFLAVLLLRESQLSAARWAALASSFPQSACLGSDVECGAVVEGLSQQCSVQLGSCLEEKLSDAGGPCVTLLECGDSGLSSSHTAFVPTTRVFAVAPHLSALGLTAETPDRSKSVTRVPGATGDGPSDTTWALRCLAGLSFLLHAFADYVDLLQAAPVAVPSAAGALEEEMIVLYLLQRICLSDGAASEVPLWLADHGVRVPTLDRHESTAGVFTASVSTSGALSMDDLLDWRLRNVGKRVANGGAADDNLGSPSTSRCARDSRLLSPLSSAGGVQTTPAGESSDSVPVTVASDTGVFPLSSAVPRRRAYVELLRASVHSVAELRTSGTSSRAARDRSLAAGLAVGTRELALAAFTATGLASPLRRVCRTLLIPCVSSLVVLLARDPVALGTYSEGMCYQDGTRALDALRAALQRLPHQSPPHSSLSRTPDAEGVSSFSTLGQTWISIDTGNWWELVEQAALCAALQRCVTIALETVGFLDSCTVQGLVSSAHHMLQTIGKGGDTDLPHHIENSIGSGENAPRDCSSPSFAVARTWSTLLYVLRLHSLPTLGSASGTDEAGFCADSPHPAGCETGQRTTQGHSKGSTLAPLSRHTLCRDQRSSLSSQMTGIAWDRFRMHSTNPLISYAHQSPHTVFRESLFREDGLQWGRAACRAAKLFAPAFSEATCAQEKVQLQGPTDAFSIAALSASQQTQLVHILSGVRDILFSGWEMSCARKSGTTGDTAPAFLHMNGHAVEVLHQCLVSVVESVQAQAAMVVSLSGDEGAGFSSSRPAPLHMSIVGWLKDALQRVSLKLRDAETESAPNPSIEGVVYSYELSLLVRVYSDVLQRLQWLAPLSETTSVRQLGAEAELLYERAQAPWQKMLIHMYCDSIKQAYSPLLSLRQGIDGDLGSSAATRRVKGALRQMMHLNSSSWTCTPTGVQTAPQDGHSRSRQGDAYPLQPTPALLTLTQATLRRFHQALYGMSSRFSSSASSATHIPCVPLASGEGRGHGDATWATVLAEVGDTKGCGLDVLVSDGERQRLQEGLAAAAAELYEHELCPLIDCVCGGGSGVAEALAGASPAGCDDVSAVAPSTQSDADNVRLQWYMDVLFISSVWCGEGEHTGGSTSSPLNTGAGSVVTNLFACDTLGSSFGDEVAARVVEDGPLRKVVRHLQRTCDPVRWRGAVPLVLTAYRNFILSSGHIWVAHGYRPRDEGAEERHRDTAPRGPSVAAAAAAKPYIPTGAASGAPCPTGRLLIPREGVDRLTLLPIAMSSKADRASAPMGAGVPSTAISAHTASHVSGVYSFLPPMAAALNPNLPSSFSTTGPYPMSGSQAVAASAAGMISGDGVAVAAGVSPAAVASAASALWGTTQRGWSQLWGTR